MTREDALYYACCMVAVRAIIVLCDNQYGIISVLTGVKAKIAVCSVVYGLTTVPPDRPLYRCLIP